MQRPAGNGLPGVRGKENALGTVLPGKDLAAKKASGYRLSLVIPAWNEGETIRQAVQEADAALSRITTEYEILIVDDGSSDDTADLVKAEAAANPRVRLVPHSTNRGYGAALRTGFEAATYELVAFTDADCQFDLGELEYMLPLTEHYAITTGYRIGRQEGGRRQFFSWGYNALVKLLMGSAVHDIDCALKIFHREQLQAILPQCDNFFANTEMLARARLQGLSVVEVGVHHRPRAAGYSKVSLLDIPRTLRSLLPFWWSRTLFPAANSTPSKYDGWFWGGLILLVLVAACLLFSNLGYPLVEPDEGRYAEIGREMLRSGDWIVPTLNQEPYYDKPPLLYWLVAGSLHFFGVHIWSARLVPALSAFLTILATYFFGKQTVGTRAGFLAALALSLMAGFVECGRFLVLDSVLTFFVAVSLYTAYEAVRGIQVRRAWWVASAVFCALAVLTKGPVALVLLAPPVVAYGWLNRASARLSWRNWLLYFGLVGGLTSPWFIAVTARNLHFGYEFFIEHHLKRFFGQEYHDSPIWFYVPVLLIGCLPWSLLLFPFARFLFSRSAEVSSFRPRAMGFFLLWAGWCVLFFSLSRGKLPPYIVPATPALAVLIGCYLEGALFQASLAGFSQPVRAQAPRLTVIVLCLILIAGNIWAWSRGSVDPARRFLPLVESGLAVACIAAAILWGRKVPWKPAWAFCCVLTFGLLLDGGSRLVPAWSYLRSPLARTESIDELLRDGHTAVLCYGEEWGSVPFHFDHDDLYLNGKKRSAQDLIQFLSAHPRILVIVKAGFDEAIMQWIVPPGKAVTRVLNSGQAKIYLVSAVAEKATTQTGLALGSRPND